MIPQNRSLTLKQKSFAQYYTDPTSTRIDEHGVEHKTYGNATQSYAKALHRPADATAATEGHRNLKRPHVTSEIERLAEIQGIGAQVRLGLLGDIAKSRQSTRTVRKRKYVYRTVDDGKGAKVRRRFLAEETVTDEEPKAGERVKALSVLNKMTGLDAAQAAIKEVALREYRELRHRITGLGPKKPPKTQRPSNNSPSA